MTMPNAQCPQCSATLPPGAVKCGYCGFATPWGAVLSQQQERANFLQADQAKRVRLAKARDAAKTGMILAMVGLPICCGPLSLIGGIIGWRAGNALKAEGEARPKTAVIALVLAIVSTLAMTTVVIATYLDQREKAAHLAAVGQRLEGKRDAPTLDKQTACDLVEEHLTDKGFAGSTLDFKEIHCDGAFSSADRRASQADVRFAFGDKHFTANACLERRSRWFVLRVAEGQSCAALPPPAPFTAPPRKLSDAESAADEAKAREDVIHAVSATTLKALTDRLERVRVSASSTPEGEIACSKAMMAKYVTGEGRRKVESVDLDLLAGQKQAWTMFSSKNMREIFDETRKIDDRAASATDFREGSGPLLAVYKPRTKVWPVVTGSASVKSKDFSYKGGEFEGFLMIYDVDSGAFLCQTKLVFESSDAVDFRTSRFSSDKSSAKDAIEADFIDRFENKATDVIKRAAPDLRLGYKTLE